MTKSDAEEIERFLNCNFMDEYDYSGIAIKNWFREFLSPYLKNDVVKGTSKIIRKQQAGLIYIAQRESDSSKWKNSKDCIYIDNELREQFFKDLREKDPQHYKKPYIIYRNSVLWNKWNSLIDNFT